MVPVKVGQPIVTTHRVAADAGGYHLPGNAVAAALNGRAGGFAQATTCSGRQPLPASSETTPCFCLGVCVPRAHGALLTNNISKPPDLGKRPNQKER
jgi:hypothetical protein